MSLNTNMSMSHSTSSSQIPKFPDTDISEFETWRILMKALLASRSLWFGVVDGVIDDVQSKSNDGSSSSQPKMRMIHHQYQLNQHQHHQHQHHHRNLVIINGQHTLYYYNHLQKNK